MKPQILIAIVEVIFRILTPDLLEKFADKILDIAEDSAKEMEVSRPWAAKAINSACLTARNAFNIEDND